MFWAVSFYVLLKIFTSGPEIHEVDVLYTLLFHLFLLPPVYLNLVRFVYRLRIKYAWILYAIKLIVVIGFFSWLCFRFFQDWSAKLFPGYYFISYYTWLEIALFIFIYIGVTTLIKGTRSWFVLSKITARLQEAEKEKAQMELRALKSQVNPHFLFNTLNGIYSMTLTHDKRLPETVIQLSDLMRYFLYEATDEKVPLEKELALLDNYISLQKIRLGENLKIKRSITGQVEGQMIAPLLLITFVENAFKHGNKQQVEEDFVTIDITVEGKQLDFTISNNKGVVDDPAGEMYGGIGLENVKRRLELLYPGRHSLTITSDAISFTVNLKLDAD